MDTKKPTDVGTNRTGIATSPIHSKEMAEAARKATAHTSDGAAVAATRAKASENAPPLGTVPPPASLKGAAKTALQALQGHKATVFVDKLAERLAFERTGVRLYDAVLAKIPASETGEGTLTAVAMRKIRDDELKHMHLVRDAIERMGADPTAVTPCADLKGVQGMGLVQAVTDPRSTLTECLDTLLVAELADNDGWRMLISLAEALGQDDLARNFADAFNQEAQHLEQVRRWLAERVEIQLGAKLPAREIGVPLQPA